MKFITLVVIFTLSILIAKAEIFGYPIDCDDDPSDDPKICKDNPGYDCNDPQFSVCSSCIHPGAEEVCDDYVDNNCNLDEPQEGWDDLDSTGNDEKDISCCDITSVVWKDSQGNIIEDKAKIVAGTELIIEVTGSSACYYQNIDLKVWDNDIWPDQDDEVPNGEMSTFFDTINQDIATATTTWIVEWHDLDIAGPPDYYLNVTPPSFSGREAEQSTIIKPIVPSEECEIVSVEWSPSSCLTEYQDELINDDEVTLKVTVTGPATCNDGDKFVNFKLMEYDFGVWNDDDLSEKEGFQIDPIRVQDYKAETTWTVKYDTTDDDKGVPIENLQYYLTASLGTKKKDSDRATVRMCDQNDDDCDNICNPGAEGSYCECKESECDTCSDTPACAQDLDPYGCSGEQRECMIYWSCPAEWEDHCDEEPPIWTRDTSSCTVEYPDQETEDLCAGLNIIPATKKGCVITEEFPVFTTFNVILVILLLSFYYIKRKK